MIKKAFLLIASLVLTGCASIPTQLDIQSGPDIAPEAQQEFAYYTPSGPSFNATSQEIVSGFLAAGTSPLNDYAVPIPKNDTEDSKGNRWPSLNYTGTDTYRDHVTVHEHSEVKIAFIIAQKEIM